MSIKIYNGCKTRLLNTKEFEDLVLYLGKTSREYLKSKYLNSLMLEATNLMMQIGEKINQEDELEKFLTNLFAKVRRTENPSEKDFLDYFQSDYFGSVISVSIDLLKSKIYDSHLTLKKNIYDFDAEFAFKVLDDKILAYVYNDNLLGVLLKDQILKNTYDFCEYAYWNNVDIPEDMSEEEWEKRRIDWSNVDVPKEDCICTNFGYTNSMSFPSFGFDFSIQDLEKDFTQMKEAVIKAKIKDHMFLNWIKEEKMEPDTVSDWLDAKERFSKQCNIEENNSLYSKIDETYSWISLENMSRSIFSLIQEMRKGD